MMKRPPLQKPRGFSDYMPPAARLRQKIISKAYEIAARFGFEPVETPIAEYEEVFKRALHESSSVSKEMYFIESESAPAAEGEAGAKAATETEPEAAGAKARRLALRPEGTAAVARLFVEKRLKPPCRFIYSGPMFRHERPQKGRFRQFTTIAAEMFGENDEPSEAEALSLAWIFLKELGLSGKAALEINTIGSAAERKVYIEKLVRFLQPVKNKLSGESQARLESNPLRILDSKREEDKEVLRQAPLIAEDLPPETLSRFQGLKERLQELRVPFRENPFLVRGLDYYNHLVFEIKSAELGAQDAILAGGRYDSLIEGLGGPPVPAIGWGAGVERLALLLKEESAPPPPDIALIAAGAPAQKKAFLIAHQLRESGRSVFFRFSGNFSKQMGRAAAKGAAIALIFGDKEIQSGSITVKNLKTEEQNFIKEERLESFLSALDHSG